MTWQETRGASRVVVAGVRHVAHADDAKSRTHEASRLSARSLRPRVLAAVGVGGRARARRLSRRPGRVRRSGPGSAGGRRVDSLGDALGHAVRACSGRRAHRGRADGRVPADRRRAHDHHPGRPTTPLKDRDDPVTWTLPAAECSDAQCSGTITSSSGRSFPFTWDGDRLRVTQSEKVARDVKRPCVDTVTGEEEPIALSAFRTTNHFSLKPFTGTASRMTAQATTRVTYEVFGTCKVTPEDAVLGTYECVMTPLD